MRARIHHLVFGCLAVVFSAFGSAAPPSELAGLAAAKVGADVARGGPAIVVVWAPDCLACRKSLPEIERFGAGSAQRGLAVKTVVPGDMQDEARALVSQRGLVLDVESDADRLDGASRRVLLDRPIAYAVNRKGAIVGARAGLIGAWVLEELAAQALRLAE